MKVGDLVMRLVCVEEGKWEPVLVVDDRTAPWINDVLVMNNVRRCWVDEDDLTTVEDWEEMVG